MNYCNPKSGAKKQLFPLFFREQASCLCAPYLPWSRHPSKTKGTAAFRRSLLIVFSILLSAETIAADIGSEEGNKNFLGDVLRTLQINTRTNVENLQNNITKYNLYNDGVTAPDPTTAIATTHLSSSNQYCGSNAESKFNCLTQNLLQQFVDLKFSGLVSGTRYDSDRQNQGQAFLNNLVAPTPNSQFTIDSMTPEKMQDPNFQKAYVKALTSQPFISVGQQPFIDIMARRTSAGGEPSMMDQMEQGASSRFLNPDWMTKMKGVTGPGGLIVTPPAKPEVVLLDMAQMLAFQIWLQYQQYRQMENIQATLGALLIQNVRGAQAAQALLDQGSSVQPPTSTTPPPATGTSQ